MLPFETNINSMISEAVRDFWRIRDNQDKMQGSDTGLKDQGNRSAVTGGAQMNGFVMMVKKILCQIGVPESDIFEKSTTLPGYFRPTKDWDLVVVKEDQLICAIEFKSQVGPSFGNNFNNRIEEALGSATDLWTAYREGTFPLGNKPWLGYFFLLEEHPKSIHSVKTLEPHFKVREEFKFSSYLKRYQLFCEKLITERLYDSAAFIVSKQENAAGGIYNVYG